MSYQSCVPPEYFSAASIHGRHRSSSLKRGGREVAGVVNCHLIACAVRAGQDQPGLPDFHVAVAPVVLLIRRLKGAPPICFGIRGKYHLRPIAFASILGMPMRQSDSVLPVTRILI